MHILRSSSLLVAFVYQLLLSHTQAQSGSKTDVVFLLDSSDAVGATKLGSLRAFLLDLVQQWNIGPNGVHVSIVSDGGGIKEEFDLDDNTDINSLKQAILSVPFRGGDSNEANGIKYARDTSFTAPHGSRPDANHVIVHVTDQAPRDPAAAAREAGLAFDKDVHIYSIAVGDGSGLDQMKNTTSEPQSRYLLKADTFSSLTSLAPVLASRINNEVPASLASLPAPSSCLQQADLVFLLDSSSSVGEEEFHHLEDFLKDMIVQLPVGADKVRVGVVQIGNHPSIEFSLGAYTDRLSMMRAVDSLSFRGGGTSTGQAIDYTTDKVFDPSAGSRYNVPHIAVVITDGHSADPAATKAAADRARAEDVNLISVGVGQNVNLRELQDIADDPDSSHLFQVTSFKQLKALSQQLLSAACQASRIATAPPTLPPGVTAPVCADKVGNCAYYSKDTCITYKDWANENCAKFCGFCNVTEPVTPCDDVKDCKAYGPTICTNPAYLAWNKVNCARYCGFCPDTSETLGYYGKCFYKGEEYSRGEKWVDGCDYECVCDDGDSGSYTCYNRCPVYQDLPQECTLIAVPGECCLQPVCDFDQKVTTTQGSGRGFNSDGIAMCVFGGLQYYNGQSWEVGCDLRCTCTNAPLGTYICQSYCPTYSTVPNNCRLERKPGDCCSAPVCEFDTLTGVMQGQGTISGSGIDGTPDRSCVDAIPDCAASGKIACTNFPQWAQTQCPLYCDLCAPVTPAPLASDRCLYNGQAYKQGDTWMIDCDQECTCEVPALGYYRCDNKCPTYNDIPPGCTTTKKVGACCPEVMCTTGNYNPSTTNVVSVGNGGGISQMVNGQEASILPTAGPALVPGAQVPGRSNRIDGCLYQGKTYVQGQQWLVGCDLSCICSDAAIGEYKCRGRCPVYENVPPSCKMVTDPVDTCCSYPTDCGPNTNYVPIPVYPQAVTAISAVMSPSVNQLLNGQYTTQVTVALPGATVRAPTTPSSGAGGYCVYNKVRYNHGEFWEDGCTYNCVCEDGITGSYRCIEKCQTWINLPKECHLEPDPTNACCEIPVCKIVGSHKEILGNRTETTPTPTKTPAPPNLVTPPQPTTQAPITTLAPPAPVTTRQTVAPPTVTVRPTIGKVPGLCKYEGETYAEGQTWYDACDYKCTCDDGDTNSYTCLTRCPSYDGDFSSCTMIADMDDPQCCSVPSCVGTALPPPKYTGTGAVPSRDKCLYKGQLYNSGDVWEDGCRLQCECNDPSTGLIQCTDRCPKIATVPQGCTLVPDIANRCCQTLQCNPNPNPVPTPAPGSSTLQPPKVEVCQYLQATYYEGQTWYDGCDKLCRCERNGIYTCTDRCPSYGVLPQGCLLVTDDLDPCCKVAKCTPEPGKVPTSPPKTVTGNALSPDPGQVPNLGACVYKGVHRGGGEQWEDGCDYRCTCEDASTGSYRCIDRCPNYGAVPPNCQLVKDASDPCCDVAVCDPKYVTPMPGAVTTVEPPRTDVCVYEGQRFTQGQVWYTDGCDYKCVCEDAVQNIYRCTDRCSALLGNLPAECKLVPDPDDPLCCEVASCVPAPSNTTTGYLIPTLPPSAVTGRQVAPAPLPGQVPRPDVCIYNGNTYNPGQRWTDGCQYNCVCEGSGIGKYSCTEICQDYSVLPAQCSLVADPTNPCCKIPFCDTNLPTPPTLPPQATLVPGVNRVACVYNGVAYYQGSHWNDGCDLTCICEDATINKYRCDQRCPRYDTVPTGCSLETDTNDACCQTLMCVPSAMPSPGPVPYPTPYPIPAKYPGKTTGQSVGNSTGFCEFNGQYYRKGETWADGCVANCVCLNQDAGIYECTERCPQFLSLPPICQLVPDPADACCEVPRCGGQPTTPGSTESPTPRAGTPTITPPTNIPTLPTPSPTPSLTSTQAPPKDVCIYKGRYYTQGQVWYDGCEQICRCENSNTNYTMCNQRCKEYLNTPATCTLVADPNDPTCCSVPDCSGQGVTGLTGKITGYATPPTGTVTPIFGTYTPVPRKDSCLYKGLNYATGQRWRDGCEYSCECLDGVSGRYECLEICPTYPNPQGCPLVREALNPCCLVPSCSPDPGATPIPAPTPYPLQVSTLVPQTAFCIYKGTPYKQYAEWKDGCELLCRCEDASLNQINCEQRCAEFSNFPADCSLITDPTDACCQVPVCIPQPGATPSPNYTVTGVRGSFTGNSGTPTDPNNPDVCVYHGQTYNKGSSWMDGCSLNCSCSGQGLYTCTDRCQRYPVIPQGCQMVPDVTDQCCEILQCSPSAFPTPNPVPQPGTKTTLAPPTTGVCVYNGQSYRQDQVWYDGCSLVCTCDDALNNLYTCRNRCPVYDNVNSACVMIPDPQDPVCCTAPNCPALEPGKIPIPGPVTINQVPGKIVGVGVVPTPTPMVTPVGYTGTTVAPPTRPPGCVYKGQTYRQSDQWTDGCDWNCVCEDEVRGLYSCTSRCPTQNLNNLPQQCVLVTDPQDNCCAIQYCDFLNPTPFPGGIPTPAPGQVFNVTATATSFQGANEFCVYGGSFYRQGDVWNDGCDQVCQCDDAKKGLYTCRARCGDYFGLPDTCSYITDPTDQCCLIPSCAPPVNPTPGPGSTLAPGYTITAAPPVSFTGRGGQPGQPNGQLTGKTGYNNVCIYKGQTYIQDEKFDDACLYQCTCEDALTGQFRCTQRCARYENLPAGCQLVEDPNDICCQVPRCPTLTPPSTTIPTPSLPPSPTTPTATPSLPPSPTTPPTTPSTTPRPTTTSTTPPNVCVYDGQYHVQGDRWLDDNDCSTECTCDDGANNKYTCFKRCPVYTELPSFCYLAPVPSSPCCQSLRCTINGVDVTDFTPVGTATVTGGFSGSNAPLTPQGKPVCIYNGQTYQPGDAWFDGCDKVCSCSDEGGYYTCISRCPSFATVQPQANCSVTDLPGRCCPSVQCNNPLLGGYNPVSEITTVPPKGQSPGQIVIANPSPGPALPGGGYPVPSRLTDFSGLRGCLQYDASLLPATCTLTSGRACCSLPECQRPDGTTFDPVVSPEPGMVPVVPMAPTTFTGVRPATFPGESGSVTGSRNGCMYKDQLYNAGDTWSDGCKYTCECVDATLGLYTCSPKCPSYEDLPATCRMTTPPSGQCCGQLQCDPYPTVATPSTPPPAPTLSTPDSSLYDPLCHDVLTNCRAYNKDSCQGEFESWARKNCNLTCGYCSPSYTTVEPPCVDFKANCQLYGKDTCTAFPVWAETNCRQFCDFCGGTSSPTITTTTTTTTQDPDLCVDKVNCLQYGASVCTDPNYSSAWVVSNCPKYCGLCDVCTYNNVTYKQDETWNDGCNLDCTCLNATSGRYICNDKCPTYPSLPPECRLVSRPGECCQEPECQGRPQTKGCLYKGTAYSEGAQWTDGCDFDCTCIDSSTGDFRCRSICTNWNIPPQCVLGEPEPGLCCGLPQCPYPWSPPADYVPR